MHNQVHKCCRWVCSTDAEPHAELQYILKGDANLRIISTDASGCFFTNVTFTAVAEIGIGGECREKLSYIHWVQLVFCTFILFCKKKTISNDNFLFCTLGDYDLHFSWWRWSRIVDRSCYSLPRVPIYVHSLRKQREILKRLINSRPMANWNQRAYIVEHMMWA